MAQRCKNCGEDQAKFPLRAQPEKTLMENYREGTIIWKNLFKMTLQDLAFILIVLAMSWAYAHDTKECKYIIEHPKEVCEQIGANFPVTPSYDAFKTLLIANISMDGGKV